jgi:Protein of Unknown function (DUF2784)
MRPYGALAEIVLLIHLLWCVWILLGWIWTRGRRILTWIHMGSLAYAIFIELTPWPPCPLTVAENWLEARAGVQPPRGPFLLRVLDATIYPDLPEWLVVASALAVCVVIIGIYLRRFRRGTKASR